MSKNPTTAQERLERLTADLSGARVSSRAGGRLRLNRSSNLLLGAALHAAARVDRNLALTDLEQQLVDVLGKVLTEEGEVAAFGRAYTQATARGAVDILPESITSRPVEDGYALADLLTELPALGQEVMAQPNFSIVDVSRIAPGEPLDSEEFKAGMAEYGRGITIVDGPPLDRAAEETLGHFALRMHSFHCLVESHESGTDEIYWGLAAGSDTSVKKSWTTREYHEVSSGSWHTFDPGSYLFAGSVRESMAAEIEVWEADHSGSSFMASLRDVLSEVSERAAEASKTLSDMDSEAEKAAQFAALVYVVAGLLDAFLGWITNEDDLVLKRTIRFTRAGLAEMSRRPNGEDSWWFGGGDGGEHTLYLRCGEGAVRAIADGWPGLKNSAFADSRGAAVTSGQHTYFFKGTDYIRYDNTREVIDVPPTKIAAGWPGLQGIFIASLGASCQVPGDTSNVYLFRGEYYTRYNVRSEETVVPSTKIADGWPALRHTPFASSVNAAVKVPGSDTDVYLFKDDEYVRYNTSSESISSGPYKIAAGWPGLQGTEFTYNIDAASEVPGSDEDVYLFKGGHYVRYATRGDFIRP
ncbi:hemopexin repeat-containing protein [Streptomyces sp. NPDC058401]|uniref:hemopexin repeat-containing protein n=1 Tax=Streptomyces sp. NPDC058401 TaxID=3346480 RepID=UPI003653318B